jgi:hypothetical protein
MISFLSHTNISSSSYNSNDKNTDKTNRINNAKNNNNNDKNSYNNIQNNLRNNIFTSPEIKSNETNSNKSQFFISPMKSLNTPSISIQKNTQINSSVKNLADFNENTHQLNIGKKI